MSKDIDDLTLGQLRAYAYLAGILHDSAMGHGMSFLLDDHHTCDGETGENIEAVMDEAPDFDDDDIRSFLAYESAAIANFRIVRLALRQQGCPVEIKEWEAKR